MLVTVVKSAVIADCSDVVVVFQCFELARHQVESGYSFRAKQVEITVAIARDMHHIVAEKAFRITAFIGINAQMITVIAVQSHACGNPDVAISIGIKAVYRDL